VSDEGASLDPGDWDAFAQILHAAVDQVVGDMATIRDGPAWRPVPGEVKEALHAAIPAGGEPLAATYARFRELIEPYPTGNVHPRFFGWVHGGGSAAGVLAELLAAGMNANVGGREHAAVYVERAVVRWFADLFGFPAGASGILTSGTSMGNLLALVAARDAALGAGARDAGIAGAPLVAYAAAGVHDSVGKAMAVAGLGRSALRETGVDERRGIAVPALREQIRADRAAGMQPFLVVATAGSVDVGAFDPLEALADLCAAERLWLHVDGAFGALVVLSPALAHLVRGIERADSIAFDAHKWLQAPYAAGCVLFRDEAAHRAPFASAPAYLKRTDRGTGAGAPWYADYGIELSREFRALKIWFILRHYGPARLGATIARTCELATQLGERIEAAGDLELLAPVQLNIVCFRVVRSGFDEGALDRLNAAIAIAVQESGAAVPSTTRIDGRLALRVCIVNHRTVEDDLDVLLAAVRAAASEG
jgi:aromatic-L-amino-acid decarboxylase